MSVWFFCLAASSYKTLGQHPGATSHPIRAFKLVNIVYHTTHLTPSNTQGERDGNPDRPELTAVHPFHPSIPLNLYIPPLFKKKIRIRSNTAKGLPPIHPVFYFLLYAYCAQTHTEKTRVMEDAGGSRHACLHWMCNQINMHLLPGKGNTS